MRFVVSLIITLVAHLLLGWSWSIAGGIAYGYWLGNKEGVGSALVTGLMGALCVGMAWGVLIIYNIIVAQEETLKMFDIMAGILGNLDSSLIVVLTVLIGAVLGLLGALVGNQVRRITQKS